MLKALTGATLGLLLLGFAGICHAEEVPTAVAAPPALAPMTVPSKTELPIIYSQTDPRWKSASLGKGTIRDRGCFITDFAMMAFAEGLPYDPFTLSRLFMRSGILLRDGSLVTSLISRVLPSLEVADRFLIRASMDISTEVSEQIAQGRYVLLRLAYKGHQHWVLATQALDGDLMIADPNGGKLASFTSLYGSLNVIKEVLSISKGN